ncbi:MAG: hypothetical protein U0893_03810 [Chloroflexota bacterium]
MLVSQACATGADLLQVKEDGDENHREHDAAQRQSKAFIGGLSSDPWRLIYWSHVTGRNRFGFIDGGSELGECGGWRRTRVDVRKERVQQQPEVVAVHSLE